MAAKQKGRRDATPREVQFAYDTRGFLATINAAGSLTTQIRDALGNLAQEADPNNAASGDPIHTTHRYDSLHRLIETLDRLPGPATYAYDVNDHLNTVTAPNGLTTAYEYDDLGNLLKEISPQRGTLTYTYDAAGNVASITDARGTTYFTYTAFGQIATQERTELGEEYTTSYTYDAADRIASLTYPDGRIVTYTRDAIGRVTKAEATVGGSTTTIASSIQYRADGLPVSITFGNDVTETRTYDLKGQLTSQSIGSISRTYSYDLNGNVTAIEQVVIEAVTVR